MLKKLIFLLLIFSSLFIYNSSYADLKLSNEQLKKNTFDSTKKTYDSASQKVNEVKNKLDQISKIQETLNSNEDPNIQQLGKDNINQLLGGQTVESLKENLNTLNTNLNTAATEYSKATQEYKKTELYKNSPESQKDLSSRGFQINVGDLTPTDEDKYKGTTPEVINKVFGNLIQKMMIGLGSVSLLVMTFGGGYMVVYHGQDELLSKGKGMFTSGIIALIVSLSSYYIVDLLRYIIYS